MSQNQSEILRNVKILFARFHAIMPYMLDHHSSASLYRVLCWGEILRASGTLIDVANVEKLEIAKAV